MARVRLALTVQFDPTSAAETQQTAEQLARGLSVSDLTDLWLLVDQAIRHPAHLERVKSESDIARKKLRADERTLRAAR